MRSARCLSQNEPDDNADGSSSTRFYYGGSDLSHDFANHPRQNHSWLGCRAAWAYTAGAAVWTGDVPQARPVDDGAVVEVANRTHNTFSIEVDVKLPSRIRVNSAYERGWQSNVGTVVEDHQLLALDLPPGRPRSRSVLSRSVAGSGAP